MEEDYYKHKYFKYLNKYKKLRKNNKPYIVITAGPTGSGKSKLQEKISEIIGIDIDNFVKLLIDDLVMKDPLYKENVDKIIKKYNDKLFSQNVPDEAYEEFNKAYFSSRRSGCHHMNEKSNCDEILDNTLSFHLTNGNNIIFETTGENSIKWLLDIIPINYNIIIGFSVVQIDKLIDRNQSRLKSTFDEYMKTNENAPRLPNLNKEFFGHNVEKIYNNLLQYYENCINQKDKEFCKNRKIRLLVYDNNEEMKLTYDSDNVYNNYIDNYVSKKQYL
jgi:hypothetical protein